MLCPVPFEHEIIENSFTKVGDIRDTVECTYDQIRISFEIYTVGLAQARPNELLMIRSVLKSTLLCFTKHKKANIYFVFPEKKSVFMST